MQVGRTAGLATIALATLVAACVPQVNFDPVAVRSGPSGEPEILYTSCAPAPVKVVEIVAVEESWGDRTPRLWKIEFPNGTTLTSFIVGSTPEGAVERVPWQPPENTTSLAARMVLDGDVGIYQGFALQQLKPGEVIFHDQPTPANDFTRETSCN